VFLQLAKIEFALGNTPGAMANVDRSIVVIGNCVDAEFFLPMFGFIGILDYMDGQEAPEPAAAYIGQILRNTMTVRIGSLVPAEDMETVDVFFAGDFTDLLLAYPSQRLAPDDSDEDAIRVSPRDFIDDFPVFMGGKLIYGIEPQLLFKNGRTLDAVLRGEGLAPYDTITVALRGTSSGAIWDAQAAFTSPEALSVAIPADIGADVYDVYVAVNGRASILSQGLAVRAQCSGRVTDFGQYRFFSSIRHEDRASNVITLSGNVTMNGWLSFNGDVTLSGSLGGGSISLSDHYGATVRYRPHDSVGLAGILAGAGLPVSLPPLGAIILLSDPAYEQLTGDFRVDAFPLAALDLGGYFEISGAVVRLFPNRLTFGAQSVSAALPHASAILVGGGDLFSFEHDLSGIVSARSIGLDIRQGHEPGTPVRATPFPVGLGNMPVRIAPQETKVHIDTLDDIYEFGFTVSAPFLDPQSTLALRVEWTGSSGAGLVPAGLRLFSDSPLLETLPGAQITLDGFALALEDIDTERSPAFWAFEGGCGVYTADFRAISGLEGLRGLLGAGVTGLELEDMQLGFSLGRRYISGEAEAGPPGGAVGRIRIEMGNAPYATTLLNMNPDQRAGLRFSFQRYT
jgi:hypothetical protein